MRPNLVSDGMMSLLEVLQHPLVLNVCASSMLARCRPSAVEVEVNTEGFLVCLAQHQAVLIGRVAAAADHLGELLVGAVAVELLEGVQLAFSSDLSLPFCTEAVRQWGFGSAMSDRPWD